MPSRFNIPPITRVLIGALVVQSVLDAAIRYRQWSSPDAVILVPYLVLVPHYTLNYPWTIVSAALVESNIFSLGVAAVASYHAGRYLERAWSGPELAKFVAVVAIAPNLLCLCFFLLFYTLTRNDQWMVTPISGSVSLQISFLVAFSQLVPAHTVTMFRGILSLRVPRFPLIYVGLVLFLSLVRVFSIASAFLAVLGFLTSWVYLRFYKAVFPDLDASQPSSLRGDASETFAFAEFFPAPVKPLVSAASAAIFSALVTLRVCDPFTSHAANSNAISSGADGRGAPGSARAEAERRRALALRTLDQRLQVAAVGTSASASASIPTSVSAPRPPPNQPLQPQPAGQQVHPAVQTQPLPNVQIGLPLQPRPVQDEPSDSADQEDSSRS